MMRLISKFIHPGRISLALYCDRSITHLSISGYHTSAVTLKDKIFKDIPAKKSKATTDSDESGMKKIRSDEELKKLNDKRQEREQKKKEIRVKQIEIQKKRDATKESKTVKKPSKSSSQQDDDE